MTPRPLRRKKTSTSQKSTNASSTPEKRPSAKSSRKKVEEAPVGPAPWHDPDCSLCGGSGWKKKQPTAGTSDPEPCRICLAAGEHDIDDYVLGWHEKFPNAVERMSAQTQEEDDEEEVDEVNGSVPEDEADARAELSEMFDENDENDENEEKSEEEPPAKKGRRPRQSKAKAKEKPRSRPVKSPPASSEGVSYILAVGSAVMGVDSVSLTELLSGELGKQIADSLGAETYYICNAYERWDELKGKIIDGTFAELAAGRWVTVDPRNTDCAQALSALVDNAYITVYPTT